MMSFLDLRNASEKERREIEDILNRRSRGVELPLEFNEADVRLNCATDGYIDEDESYCEGRKEDESIDPPDLTILPSGHASLTTAYLPAFVGNQGQPTAYDPKRQPMIPQDSYKGHYYPPPAFGPQMAISSKTTPDSMKVPFYSSPPHFGPVITSISHVSPAVGSTAPALSPTGIAVVSSAANSIVEDNDTRVTVTGNNYPIQAYSHYTGNPYIPSHGATLPMPPHMYPVYLPVQFAPPHPHQFYTPIPQALAQNHTPRHPVVNRSLNIAQQNGSVPNQIDNVNVNGVSVSGDELCEIKQNEDKCEEQQCDESKSEVNEVSVGKDVTLQKCADKFVASADDVPDVDTRTTDEQCDQTIDEDDGEPEHAVVTVNGNGKTSEEITFGDLSDKACESANSSIVSVASNKDAAAAVTSSSGGTRSWADLFKGRENVSAYQSSSAAVSPYSQNSNCATQLNSNSDARLTDESHNAVPANSSSKLNDAQNIAVHEDALVNKLGKKLKEIHLKHSLPFLIPRGFVNRGNWCYINATLQALLYCPPFYNLMREVGEVPGIVREKSCTPIIDSFAKFFANFLPSEPMMKKAKLGGSFSTEDLPTAEPFEPKCIYDVLGAIKSECLKGKQEDAEEFLSCVLNGLHDEMVMLFKHVAEPDDDMINANGHSNDDYVDKDGKVNNDDDSMLWKEVGPRHKALPMRSTNFVATPISDIFGGSILSVRTAGKDVCGNRQPFFTLQLDIQSDKIKSVEDALKALTSTESLQGYTCPKTKQAVDASYQSFLFQLPPILILHLKLFGYDKDGGSRKMLKKIDYPIDFELPRECIHHDRSGDKNKYSKSYKLLAVVHHDGHESVKGHYTTDIYHIGSSLWLRCDDNTIKPISTQQLLNPQLPRVPYLLFYRRCDTLRGHNQSQRGQQQQTTH